MAHSYIKVYIHYTFSTKNRVKSIPAPVQNRLWAYMGGIARENKMTAMEIGGIDDHAHVLLSLPSTISIAKAIQLVKGGSSKWMHDTFPEIKDFAWQEGYGAFSVSMANINTTINYIKNQKEHHQQKGFQEEYLAFLKKHNIEYDERYIWG